MDPSNAGYAGNAEFHKVAIPMVRRTFPEFIAHDIVGVQPMTGPVGLAFALRFRGDSDYGNHDGLLLLSRRASGRAVRARRKNQGSSGYFGCRPLRADCHRSLAGPL